LFDLDLNQRLKSGKLNENIEFMRWVDERVLGIVGSVNVYHWAVEGDSPPQLVFSRLPQLTGHGITNYRVDSKREWCLVVGMNLLLRILFLFRFRGKSPDRATQWYYTIL
jgi:hypothetical protein